MMNKKLLFIYFFPLVILCSCSSKPSHSDIEKKILMEYVCPETAKVNELHIVSTKDAESIMGMKGYQYTVSGEVEWKNGCDEFGTGIAPGFKEKFENKSVTLIKGEDGWQ